MYDFSEHTLEPILFQCFITKELLLLCIHVQVNYIQIEKEISFAVHCLLTNASTQVKLKDSTTLPVRAKGQMFERVHFDYTYVSTSVTSLDCANVREMITLNKFITLIYLQANQIRFILKPHFSKR